LIVLATSQVQVHSIFKGLQHGKPNNKGKNKEKIDKNGERMTEKTKHTGKKVCVICDFCPFSQLTPLLSSVFTYKKKWRY